MRRHRTWSNRGFGVLLAATSLLAAHAGAQVVPAAGTRAAAEWEPAIGAMVRWPLGVPMAVLQEVASDDLLYVFVSSTQQASAQNSLTSQGVNMTNVRWIVTPTDNIWTRDWGPIATFTAAGQYRISDYNFTGYSGGPFSCDQISWFDTTGWNNDDNAPAALATHLGAPRHLVGAFLVGGNYLMDGAGTSFSSCLLFRENLARGLDNLSVRAVMSGQLGNTRHITLPNFETSGIQHIDCAIKPVDEETILVKRTPSNHPSFAATNQIAQILSTTLAPSGRPYRVLRLDCPYYAGSSITNYTNSLILNRKILMPAWGIPGDAVAAQTFRDAFPGYEVVQFPWNAWYSNDALHCRVRAVWDPGMLHLRVERLASDVNPSPSGYTIFTNVRAYSGQAVTSSSLRWRVAGPGTPGSWNSAPLIATPQQYRFSSVIPAQAPGTRIEYYLSGSDASGRSETLPRTAPQWTYSFTVINTGLDVSVASPPTLIAPGVDTTTVDVTINPGTDQVVAGSRKLLYRTVAGAPFIEADLTPVSGNVWRATLPRVDCDDALQYYVRAQGVSSGVVAAPFGAPASVFAPAIGATGTVTLLGESFEGSTLPAGWSASGLWSINSPCETGLACDGACRLRFAAAGTCTYNTGVREQGAVTTPPIAIPSGTSVAPTLTFCYTKQTENEAQYDLFRVYVNGTLVDTLPEASSWTARTINLSGFEGQTVTIAFDFDTIDNEFNAFPGVRLDNVRITAQGTTCTNVACDRIDFNNDGIESDPTDIEAFLSVYSGGPCIPGAAACSDIDFNNDGIDNDPTDIEAFLSAYSGGPC